MIDFGDVNFQPMLITDVFQSMSTAGRWFDLAKASRVGKATTPYVARSGGANGIGTMLPRQSMEPPNKGNAITIGVSTATVFYQPVRFYTSKEIQVLRHDRLTADNSQVLVSLLRQQMSKFKWGNGASLARLRATRIMVPAGTNRTGELEVDWDVLDRLGERMRETATHDASSALTMTPSDSAVLPELTFAPVQITDVFQSMTASRAWYDKTHLEHGKGRNLYLSQIQSSNGIATIVADQAVDPEPGNCITVTLKTQATYYQPAPFYTAQNFLLFRHERLNEYSGVVLVAIMRRAMAKFSWGYGVSMARLSKTRIMVPVTTDEHLDQVVDWEGLTAYGKALRVRAERELDPVIGAPA